MVAGEGAPDKIMGLDKVREILAKGIPKEAYQGKKVLVLTPDATRTCPLPMMVRALAEVVGDSAGRLDFMVALGTHPPLGKDKILDLYGIQHPGDLWSGSSFLDHRWDKPETFCRIGTISREELESLSQGLLAEKVDVEINRAVLDYDLLLVLGPVFPHEVVGFSGGAKYLFPGISGGEFLHFFHWLGAVITCRKIIGVKETPVRELIHKAAAMVPVAVQCAAMVVGQDGRLCGLFVGDLKKSWSLAADLSSKLHVVLKEKPYELVLGCAAELYDELWTAGKVMYKLEQVVAPGGTLIIYGPHVREVSRTWGRYIESIGYHVRDYFLAQMEKFRGVPKGVLAHLTHVKGTGTYSHGVETPDVNLVLATGIPEELCRKIHLGYMDHRHLSLEEYRGREQEGILLVERAGEILHKLKEPREVRNP